MFSSELYKIMVNKITFIGFKGGDRSNRPPGSAPAGNCTATQGNASSLRSSYNFYVILSLVNVMFPSEFRQ